MVLRHTRAYIKTMICTVPVPPPISNVGSSGANCSDPREWGAPSGWDSAPPIVLIVAAPVALPMCMAFDCARSVKHCVAPREKLSKPHSAPPAVPKSSKPSLGSRAALSSEV